ncbi:DUF2911 domain-containing protein [Sphingobacterium thalpophilum]|uniref:Protein of uncharacterized function (DUF2911) n=1 Tax=Sphingobacterium thalpophilum TaxID=259 RepID=A0A4U9UX07_9SPHI|nr:DUF2911 domain-containing protein [Sphingobacterium thalpophilum]VTR37773.1 Protein of uncharacterised function (DUF2911) [Sphingobacterium thalpophilum]
MKKSFFTIATAAVLLLTANAASAQLKLPAASSAQTVTQGLGIENVTLSYSRPSMNGRKIFGELVPYNEVWRTGANTNTTLTFEGDVSLNGHKLAAGTYALFTIPNKSEWTVIISKNTKQWGAYTYNQAEDALRFNVKPQTLNTAVETFTISFDNVTPTSAVLSLAWEKTAIKVDLKVEQQAKILASIDEAMKGEKKPYFAAAQYYFNNNLDLNKALVWFDEAAKAQPKAAHVLYWKAKAQLKAGDKKGAIETATKGVEVATEGKNSEYIKLNTQVLNAAKK